MFLINIDVRSAILKKRIGINMEKKFYRGKNYAEEDKHLLFSLIEGQKHILESRETNSVSVKEKKEAWASITSLYNANTVVTRTPSQLKTLYTNCKRRTKKEVAVRNKERYKSIMFPETSGQETDPEIAEDELGECRRLQKIANREKNEMKKTGGGTFTSTMTERDHMVLSIIGDTVRPLSNLFDDAHSYFDNADLIPQPPFPISFSPSHGENSVKPKPKGRRKRICVTKKII